VLKLPVGTADMTATDRLQTRLRSMELPTIPQTLFDFLR